MAAAPAVASAKLSTHKRDEDVLYSGEIEVHGPLRHARPSHDGLHRGDFAPALGEQRFGGREDLAAAALGLLIRLAVGLCQQYELLPLRMAELLTD